MPLGSTRFGLQIEPRPGAVRRRAVVNGWVALLIAALPVLSVSAQSEIPFGGSYSLEIGTLPAIIGQEGVAVPIYVTNSQPLEQWQLTIEFDPDFLEFIQLSIAGTISEELGAEILDPIILGNEVTVAVAYDAQPLPPGEGELVGHLVFNVLSDAPVQGSHHDAGLDPVGEAPVVFTLGGGQIVNPPFTGGSIVIYGDHVLRVGEAEGGNYDTAVVPVYIWNIDDIDSVFRMGLEYEEVYMIEGVDLTGGVFEGGTVDLVITPGHVEVIIEPATPVSPGGEQLVGYLRFQVVDVPTLAGDYPASPVPGECSIDAAPIPNLLAGNLRLLPLFVRGDVDFDLKVTVADPVQILSYLYLGGSLPCLSAADVDDDDVVGLGDTVMLLNYGFGGGPTPPPPSPNPAGDGVPGPDPTPGVLTCL